MRKLLLGVLSLLSRKPLVEDQVIKIFVETAKDKGFNTENLIYVKQK